MQYDKYGAVRAEFHGTLEIELNSEANQATNHCV